MAVNVKMGVDIGSFKQGIQEGQNILKGLNAEMKATDAEFKATGNAEQQLAAKTKNLNSQLQVQKGIADQAQKALKAMEEAGVKPTDAAYQKMYATMMNATAGMNNAQAALNGLTNEEQKTAKGAEELGDKLDGIGKKMSLQQVISGINSITSGLENAAKMAINLGKEIVDAVSESAGWADDIATQALKYGITVERYQQMQGLVASGMDTTVEAMLKAQKKLRKGMGDGTIADVLKEINVQASELKDTGGGIFEFVKKSDVQLFWEAGQALMNMSDSFDKESAAQKLFGRSWEDLVPLFTDYKNAEEYEAALQGVNTVSEEGVNNLVELNDKLGELEHNFDVLKNEMLATLAPALTKAADALSGLLDNILEYLQTPEGQQALADMEKAVSGLFDDLSEIDPEQVVSGFVDVFNSVVGSLQWLVENKDTVVGALKGIVIGWGVLKLTGGALTILNLVNGLNTLLGGGAAAGAASAGASAGASFATGFVNAFVSTAPILAGMLGVTAVAVTPATIVQKQLEEKWKLKQNERLAAAEEASAQNADFIRDAAGAVGPKKNADGSYKTGAFGFLDMNPTSETARLLMDLAGRKNQQRAELFNAINAFGQYTNGYYTTDLLTQFWANPNSEQFDEATLNAMLQNITDALIEAEKPKVQVELEVPADSKEQIEEQVPPVTIPGYISIMGLTQGGTPKGGGGGGPMMYIKGYANGLPYVPYDGYLALLHRGERVLTASANRSYTYNNNNYFGNVNLNNGQDIDALCNSIDRHNRAVQSGFGA